MNSQRSGSIWGLVTVLVCTVSLIAQLPSSSSAEDWPMWRCDAGRTGATTQSLNLPLNVEWTRQLPPRCPVWDDPLNQDMMPYDRIFEPIVMGGKLLVGFNDRNKLVAYDASSGEEIWTYFADGPVRLPPAGWEGHVYFCSDDGCLRCLSAESGELEWCHRGGPSSLKVIGNGRVISAWPARGGPVVRDGQVYFAASIWPFMGTFIRALDARTGAVIWSNEETSAQYIKQPHSAPSFAGIAPQGALVATRDFLLVPGGRSVPAGLDRHTGELRHFLFNEGGKGNGGSFVIADESEFYVHMRRRGVRAFTLETGVKTAFMTNEPVLAGDRIYAGEESNGKPVIRAYDREKKLCWEIAADARGDLILAGDHLFAAGTDRIVAVALPRGNEALPQGKVGAKIVWSHPCEQGVVRLLAGNGRLFSVSLSGHIQAYAPRAETPRHVVESQHVLSPTRPATERIQKLLSLTDAEGYALWFGIDDEALLEAAVVESPFKELVVVDSDVERVDRWRHRCDEAGCYGETTLHVGIPDSFQAPRYIANVIYAGDPWARQAGRDRKLLDRLYRSLRPYGGALLLHAAPDELTQLAKQVQEQGLENAHVVIAGEYVVVRRVGALTDTDNWTHQYGNVANTVKSNDQRVKLPLGLLWFGGSSNMDVLPRHGHGPPEQVVGGRLFIQGMDCLSARDVYTGRVLWKRKIPGLDTFDVYYDKTYKNTPLDAAYNQVHIPGANARGTNFVACEDRVYIAVEDHCEVLDPVTGDLIGEITFPDSVGGDSAGGGDVKWGYIGVYKDLLLGGAGFADYRHRHQLSFEKADSKLKKNKEGFGSKSLDRSASLSLVAFDRTRGTVKWKVDSRYSFPHNGIVAGNGRIYLLDRNPRMIEDELRRRGKSMPETYRRLALDSQSGKTLWESDGDVFGTWLGFSEDHDMLLEAGAAATDRLVTERGQGMAVYRGEDGAVVWKNEGIAYAGPCILHGDQIITNANSYQVSAGTFRLTDGSPVTIREPLTGAALPWKLQRAYGCNNIIASEHLLTFRSGAAGFYDLDAHGGVGNFGGFKSGCTSNLVVANGVLNAPDYTRTCSCGYQNQTSLALVYMPEMEYWTISGSYQLEPDWQRIQQMGINFGAPGDRRADDGVLWLESPVVGGDSPPISVQIEGTPTYFRHHATTLAGTPLAWVQASGVSGAEAIRIGMQIEPPEPDRAEADQKKPNQETAAAAGVAGHEIAGTTEPGADAVRLPEPPSLLSEKTYSVRLYFSNPSDLLPGEAVFDVRLQGVCVLEAFDIAAEADGATQALVRTFNDIAIGDELLIEFDCEKGRSVLNGVELQCTASGE